MKINQRDEKCCYMQQVLLMQHAIYASATVAKAKIMIFILRKAKINLHQPLADFACRKKSKGFFDSNGFYNPTSFFPKEDMGSETLLASRCHIMAKNKASRKLEKQ